jgi:UDP-N-acetylglucosamine--N-acetylmuramyl-(pentapeptide) pyrophosphoryl-undecaprenol N-acetylglucosamine transferase
MSVVWLSLVKIRKSKFLMAKNKKLLVMAGGTGGHVFPGLSVAKQLQKEGWEIRWLGTADRMEAELVPKHGIDIDFIRVKGLRGKGIVSLIKAPFQILNAIIQARAHIKRWKPDAVLGMGGYVSGPGGVAAWLSGIPLILHEQNAVAGLTNQWLSKIAQKVFQAFPGAFKQAEVVGNPVRQELAQLLCPTQRLENRQGLVRLLVMGGSQGAQILNQTLPETMAKLGDGYEVLHQAGKGNADSVANAYQANQVKSFKSVEFIDDVVEAYQWCDLVICRSGALTVSEVAAAGSASIFVPFMHKDRQQALNADYLVNSGAAIMIEQGELTVDKLVDTVSQLDRENLINMGKKAREAALFDADKIVADSIISITEKRDI